MARNKHKWSMVVDLDRCTGCQACVVACQAENNIPINEDAHFLQRRAIEWIRIERYWEGEFPDVKARFIPVFCQHCENAPCEPVCPVYATYHNQPMGKGEPSTISPETRDWYIPSENSVDVKMKNMVCKF